MGEIPLAHLPDTLHRSKASKSQGQSLAEFERKQVVLQLLKACRRLNELQLHLTLMAPAELCKDAEQLEMENMLLPPCFHISVLERVTERTREAAKVALCQARGTRASSTLPEHQPTRMSLQKYPQAANLQTEFSLPFFWTSHVCPFPFTLLDKLLKCYLQELLIKWTRAFRI